MQSLYKLRGVVQQYSWGGSHFIPELIDLENRDQKPFAEYWLGAHPNSPAQLIGAENETLVEAIRSSPDAILGSRVKKEFGSLPYLFKILDVRQMLSIQVHPSIASARKGYANENQKGIPVTAPTRNYKDQNHKPELMVALSDFWLLHGFKDEAALAKIFDTVNALSFLKPIFIQNGYRGLYEAVMTMPQENVDEVLAPLMEGLAMPYKNGKLDKSSEHFWAARAVESFCKNGHYDRGIFSIYLFNLLHLNKGEGIYQPAGLPHAYLEGQNVEVMANSDNVLRAGLTDKHIDVGELMKHVHFEATIPRTIAATDGPQRVYATPAAEFELTKFTLSDAAFFTTESAVVFFVYEGKVELSVEDRKLYLKRGEAAIVFAEKAFEMKAEIGPAIVFAVSTPVGKN